MTVADLFPGPARAIAEEDRGIAGARPLRANRPCRGIGSAVGRPAGLGTRGYRPFGDAPYMPSAAYFAIAPRRPRSVIQRCDSLTHGASWAIESHSTPLRT